jgi:hypothetical protein
LNSVFIRFSKIAFFTPTRIESKSLKLQISYINLLHKRLLLSATISGALNVLGSILYCLDKLGIIEGVMGYIIHLLFCRFVYKLLIIIELIV